MGRFNRYATAIVVSQTIYPDGAEVVYLAVGTNASDAIAGGPAAAAEGAPILLVTTSSLRQHRDELVRLAPCSRDPGSESRDLDRGS